jgi:putative oxidoreductase
MKVITNRAIAGEDEAVALSLRPKPQVYVRDVPVRSSRMIVPEWHDYLLWLLHGWSIPALRLALGLVFLWFGALKLLGASPVVNMLEHTYGFLPVRSFAAALGVWEVLIGVGLMVKRALRCTLGLLCLHLTGTFIALALAPALFFHDGNPLWLTAEGEFVVKNTVLIAAGLVIGGHEVKPLGGRARLD